MGWLYNHVLAGAAATFRAFRFLLPISQRGRNRNGNCFTLPTRGEEQKPKYLPSEITSYFSSSGVRSSQYFICPRFWRFTLLLRIMFTRRATRSSLKRWGRLGGWKTTCSQCWERGAPSRTRLRVPSSRVGRPFTVWSLATQFQHSRHCRRERTHSYQMDVYVCVFFFLVLSRMYVSSCICVVMDLMYIYYVTVVINVELRKFSKIVYLADPNWNLSLIIGVDILICDGHTTNMLSMLYLNSMCFYP